MCTLDADHESGRIQNILKEGRGCLFMNYAEFQTQRIEEGGAPLGSPTPLNPPTVIVY